MNVLARAQRRYPLLQVLALTVVFLYGAATIDGFSTTTSIQAMLVLAALLGIAAAGQTLVIILGGLDLSVPGVIVMGSIMVSQLCGTHRWPLLAALLLIIAVAGGMGAIAGFLASRYLVSPLIVTLATGSIAVGGCLVWTKGQLTGAAPNVLSELVSPGGTTFGIGLSPIVMIWLAFTIAMAIVLHRTVIGRRIYATGDNPRAASLSLIPVAKIWTGVFAVSAILSALTGVLLAGFSGADQSLGDPYLFQGLTAVIVGGTAFAGARGDYTHTAIGALLMTALTTILVGNGYETADQQIVFGVLILLVVAGYGRERKLRDRV